MSAGAWLRSQRDRPIGDGERRIVFTLVVVVAVAATLLLAITTPGAPSPRTATRPRGGARREAPAPAVSVVAEERAAREFLHGYLAYLYGRQGAARLKGATPALTHSLRVSSPRVPPGIRARRARIVALHVVDAPAGALGVTAIINDGGLVDYPITLFLARHGQGLLVSGLVGA